jgi:hypothetical protein
MKMSLATSATRVEDQTAPHVNEQIRRTTEMSIAYHQSNPDRIPRRLRELDAEWDIERMLETGSSTLSLIGLTLGILGRRRWLILPLAVQGFFLQHALQGWCPPIEILRRAGFRTRREIETERYALMAIRDEKGSAESTPRRRQRASR